MPFTPGWNPDRQSRVARQSQQQDHAHGPLPLVSRGGAPTVTTFDYPNPSFLPLRNAQFVALRATNLGEANGLLPELLNKDRVFAGAGQVPSLEQQQALPPRAAPRGAADLVTFVDASEYWLFGTDKFPPGQSTHDSRRPAAYLARAFLYPVYDANSINAILPEQVTTDTLPPGQSTLDSRRPAAYLASAYRYPVYDANYGNSLVPELIGQDAMATGAQLSGNAPAAPRRAVDYTHTADLIPNLIGQDAMASGQQWTELPPIGALRARDYTFLQASAFWLLRDAMVAGAQRAELPPIGALRARDYTFTQAEPLNLRGQDAMAAGAQLSGPAPAAPRREVDYTHTADLIPNLVGQDAMVTGVQSVALPPRAAPRGQDFWLPAPLALLTTVVQQIPYGAQSTDSLPPRAAARARDYSIAASFPLELNGKDQFFSAPGQVPAFDWSYLPPKPRYQQGTGEAVQDLLSTLLATVAIPGKQSTDLPPRAAPRALDYTLLASLIPELIGQDAMAVGVQLSGNAPSGARRAVDYSFLASFPLELIGRDAMTAGDQLSDLPYPRGAARARDYTIAAGYLLELIGQDAMIAGDQWTELGPRGAARARDYSLTASYALANTTPQRDLSYVLGEPRSAWRVRAPRAGWETNEPTSTWRTRQPQE